MDESITFEKSIQFGVRMIRFAEFLIEKKQRVIADQILRSGTSIGANIAEGKYAASKADFINKNKIAEKEANETAYWLKLLKAAEIVDEKQYESLFADLHELQCLIGATIITAKSRTTK